MSENVLDNEIKYTQEEIESDILKVAEESEEYKYD